MKKVAESRITRGMGASIPVAIRKALGLGPGDVLEWEVEGSTAIVRAQQAKGSAFKDFKPLDFGMDTDATAEHDEVQ